MTVRQLITQVRDKTQDTDGTYIHDSEYIDMFNECKRYMAAERMENNSSEELSLEDSINSYDIDGVLRYVSAKDSLGKNRPLYVDDGSGDSDVDGIIILNYNKVYVNTPTTGTTIIFKTIEFPEDSNMNDTVRYGDENAYKNYMLSKAYEKDTDMEQFQKAEYFDRKFIEAMNFNTKSSKLNYINNVQVTESTNY